MQRYFLDEDYFNGKLVTFDEETVRHITRVMRMKAGAEVILCNKSGTCFLAEITQEEPLLAEIMKDTEEETELPVRVTIAQGLPKTDKLEHIIQKGTELGASAFLPFAAERSIAKVDKGKAGKKAARWRKIAKEASEQSHRRSIPDIAEPVDFEELLHSAASFDHLIVAYEEQAKEGDVSSFRQALVKMNPGERVLIVVGPEGGLSRAEAERLSAHGAVLCSFGPRILRTETAPLYALSVLSYYFELSG